MLGGEVGLGFAGLRRAASAVAVVGVALVIALTWASTASAESFCTDTWTGPAEGNWATESDWSTGLVPSSTDVACIGSGKTAKLTAAPFEVGVVQGEGAVRLDGGSLEVTNGLEPSSIATLILEGGSLRGAAEVRVTKTLTAHHGEGTTFLKGSGLLVLTSGAAGVVEGEPTTHVSLEGRSVRNEGTLTVGQTGGVIGSGHAQLTNSGTLVVNGEPSGENLGLLASAEEATLVNTGTVEKTEGSGTTLVSFAMKNEGSVSVSSGKLEFSRGGTSGSEHVGSWSTSGTGKVVFAGSEPFALGSSAPMSGTVEVASGAFVGAGKIEGATASITVGGTPNGTLELTGGSASTIKHLTLAHGTLKGSAQVNVTEAFTAGTGGSNYLPGSGTLVLQSGASGTVGTSSANGMSLEGWNLVNDGTLTVPKGTGLKGEAGSRLINNATLIVNGEPNSENHGLITTETPPTATLVNKGTLKKTEGTGKTTIQFKTENFGRIREETGAFEFTHAVYTLAGSSQYGRGRRGPGHKHPECGEAVSCATGNESFAQTDFAVGGRGAGLDLERTYNSQAAAEGAKSAFGYGWTSSFSDHLTVEGGSEKATLTQADGATVAFTESGGSFTAAAGSQDKLSGSAETGYTLTTADQTKWKFAGASGRLESITDRNGNATTLAYTEAGRLETVTDPAGRKLTFAYNGEGLVESVKDPMGHTVKYAYEGSNLKSVTMPGEETARWQFKYDGSDQITEEIDGRAGKTTREYNGSHQVIAETDPLKHELTFSYKPFDTQITNHATGAVTDEQFTSEDEPFSTTHGYGTAAATTISYTYNEAGQLTGETDGNGHTTEYGYDAEGNPTSVLDADGHETKTSYDAAHDVISTTTPEKETTTIKRDEHGNAEGIERPAPGETTQTTKYKYTAHGQLEQVEDPLKHITKYEYDAAGDRTAETDPESDKQTFEYDEDSNVIVSVSPRGNAEGAEPAKYTTKTERDPQERPIKITDPLGHTTKYKYDGNGDTEKLTDANSHSTTYSYDADEQPTKVEQPDGATKETEYNGDGLVVAQIDGNKQTTKLTRNILGEVTEEEDPLKHKTKKEYDAAGNLTKVTDAAGRTTKYKYDPANHLTAVEYSEEATPSVKYEYDADGNRIKMEDGTGTTKYTYDQLGRLTETKDGHGNVAKYEYNLTNQNTKIIYPNGKAVTWKYDKSGRLEKVEDWLEHATIFTYDPDSNLTKTVFPANEDKYAFNEADQQTKTEIKKGEETLATLTYTPDNVGQLEKVVQTGVPGPEETKYSYDEDNRLVKDGANELKYDAADNPTTTPGSTNTFNEGSELTKGTGVEYSYNELGDRTKRTPSSGPATTYSYDQAGDLTKVERPEEGETAKIKDSYTYDGSGLRASQTIGASTTYMTWDPVESLPLLLTDGTNSYIFGPEGDAIEQVSSEEAAHYLHHDRRGSTRLITSTTGTVSGKCTYAAYGIPTCEGAVTTPLGYDGEYTSSDTGLIYLRARVYDPTSAEFMSVDPAVAVSRAPYSYAGDEPLSKADPTGLLDLCLDPTGTTCKAQEAFAKELENGVSAAVNTATFGLLGSKRGCSVGSNVGGWAGLVASLLPDDLGPRLFARFAERFPKTAALVIRQKAYEPVTQPGRAFVVHAIIEKIAHFLGG